MKKSSDAEQLFFFKKVVKLPIYYGNFIILFSNDAETVCRITNTNPYEIDLGSCSYTFHRFVYGNKESWAVCFNFWAGTPISIGVITHEIVHATHRILESREVIPDFINDEPEAYLAGWLADEVQDFMIKCNLQKV